MTDEPSRSRGRDPWVSLIVAMRNEAPNVQACLRSILRQEYPRERLEVLVYDGESDDGTKEIAEETLAGLPLGTVRVNPRRTQASSWNLGIEAASGSVIGIVSGHAVLDAGYVRAAVDCLSRTGADMVGGPVRAVGVGALGQAIALAMSTPFGVGGASFRYLEREQEVDTVFMGLCRAATYRRFRFDEEMVRNQDDELSYRLLDAGGRIVCDPRIKSTYLTRGTLGSLWSQYHDYGYWKVRVAEKHPSQIRPRHLAPSALVAALVAGVVGGLVWPWALAALGVVIAAYIAAMAIQILKVRRGVDGRVLALLPAVFLVLHLGYGTGFLRGLIARGPRAGHLIRALSRGLLRRARS